MSLLDFPVEVLDVVLETCVVVNGLEEALRLRFICHQFDDGIIRGICTTKALETTGSKLPLGKRIWVAYLVARVQGNRAVENSFAKSIQGAIDFIVAERPEDEPRRSEYVRALCSAAYERHVTSRQKLNARNLLLLLTTQNDDFSRVYSKSYRASLSEKDLAAKASLESALSASASLGILPLFKKLLEQAVNLDGSTLSAALDAAVARGDVEMVRLLFERSGFGTKGPNRPSLDSVSFAWGRRGAIATAAKNGHRVILEMLLTPNITRGILGNVHEFWTYLTAIQAAAAGGQLEIIDFLMEKATARGVLDTAYDQGISYGADYTRTSEREEVKLQILKTAASHGRENILRHFLDNGADPNARRQFGSRGRNSTTLLGRAARGGHRGAVRLLLERGADPNGYEDAKPLVEAVQGGWLEVARILIAAGAEVNPKDGRPNTNPLQAALKYNQFECVKMLVEHGATLQG